MKYQTNRIIFVASVNCIKEPVVLISAQKFGSLVKFLVKRTVEKSCKRPNFTLLTIEWNS